MKIIEDIKQIEKDIENLNIKKEEIEHKLKSLIYNEIALIEGFENLEYKELCVWYKNINNLQICFRFKSSEIIEGNQLFNICNMMISKFNCELSYISNNYENELNYYFNEIGDIK